MDQTAAMDIRQNGHGVVVSLEGRLTAKSTALLWQKAARAVQAPPAPAPQLVLDLSCITYMDTAGAVFILRLEQKAKESRWNGTAVQGLDDRSGTLLEKIRRATEGARSSVAPPPRSLSFIERKGKSLAGLLADAHTFTAFTGEICAAFAAGVARPSGVRWKETLRVAERAGVDALPIVALISFIVGLVMAFQSALPMRMFGAEIYVANLIGIAMVRELGPLMTAIVLAGRSASAFAAEIGTMKINEEIDALTVMGLDPVHFLILPRVLATTLMTPLLTVFANLVGILGGAVVILSFNYPFVAYYNQVTGFVTWVDFLGGIVKCLVFGMLIAATGCLRGYQTRRGPSAVGDATTRAVVSSIVLVAVFDGIFSILYYSLGI